MLESVNRTDVNKMFLCVEVSQSFALIIDFCDNILILLDKKINICYHLSG